jgi:hypothetical protein
VRAGDQHDNGAILEKAVLFCHHLIEINWSEAHHFEPGFGAKAESPKAWVVCLCSVVHCPAQSTVDLWAGTPAMD